MRFLFTFGMKKQAANVAVVAITRLLATPRAQALATRADVSQTAEVQAYVKLTVDTFGRIDYFFNNAGIEGQVGPIAEYDEAVFDRVIAVNLKGPFLGLRHVLPVMLAQKKGALNLAFASLIILVAIYMFWKSAAAFTG